jgi:MFS family permease
MFRKRFIRERLNEDNMLEKLSIMKYGLLLTKRGLLLTIVFSLVFYTSYFVFAYYVPEHFISSINNRLVVQTSFNFVVASTLIAASFFIHRIDKLSAIYACSLATSILAVLLFFVSMDIFRLTFIFGIAIFFSVGQLAFLTYFWSLTAPEERGRVAGLNGFFSILTSFTIYAGVVGTLDFHGAVVLGIVLSLGPLVVILLKPKKTVLTAKKDDTGCYPEKRTVILYLIPWIMFSLINVTLAKNISFHISQQVPASLYLFLIVLQSIGTILGALSGGVTADFFGRRVSLAFSLTLYGISSALAGIASSFAVLYFVYFANGLSWGILLAMYSFVVWGDLSNKKNSAKMYAIGFIIFYVAQGIGLIPTGQMFQMPLFSSALVSCLLIFLSNIPIFLAPELLPSVFRERIRLKWHMSAVKKIRRSQNQG